MKHIDTHNKENFCLFYLCLAQLIAQFFRTMDNHIQLPSPNTNIQNTVSPLNEGQVVDNNQECVPQRAVKRGSIYPEYLSRVNYFSLEEYESIQEEVTVTSAYYKAITQNVHLFAEKIVLVFIEGINCLSCIHIARLGASKVYAVVNGHSQREQQNVYMIRKIVEQNQMENIIDVKHYKDFNAEIDVIVGEPMGYCLFYDGLLDRMIEARDLYLSKGGLILPDYLCFKCCLIYDEYYYDKKVGFWNEVYNVPMKTLQQWITQQPIVRVVDPMLVTSNTVKLVSYNLKNIKYQEIDNLNKSFRLNTLINGHANGLTIWYEAFFREGEEHVEIKASPWNQNTKQTQVTLYTQQRLSFQRNEEIRVRVQGVKAHTEGTTVLTLSLNDHDHSYFFA